MLRHRTKEKKHGFTLLNRSAYAKSPILHAGDASVLSHLDHWKKTCVPIPQLINKMPGDRV